MQFGLTKYFRNDTISERTFWEVQLMETVTVHASGQSRILIGSGILPLLGREMRALCPAQTVAVAADRHVAPLYAETVCRSLETAGLRAVLFTFPAGESAKCPETWLSLLRFLAQEHLTRTDALVALGGGVTGDLTGFAAATYLRGIDLVQVPTSLLAMIDSSVGGKTAIDLPDGKNLVGAFCQPKLVLCDTDTLATLPAENRLDGFGELAKYAVLHDPALLREMQNTPQITDLVIARCVRCKRDLVEADEFDRGERRLLNLGHTLGHAIEARSGFSVSHGRAVAIGLAAAARIAAKRGLCTEACAERIESTLTALGLPVRSPYRINELLPYLVSDKKRSGETCFCILPRMVGRCELFPVPASELGSFWEEGL